MVVHIYVSSIKFFITLVIAHKNTAMVVLAIALASVASVWHISCLLGLTDGRLLFVEEVGL